MINDRIKAYIKALVEKEILTFTSADTNPAEIVFYECLYKVFNNFDLTDSEHDELGFIADIFRGKLDILNMNFDNTLLNDEDQITGALLFKLEILINLANKLKDKVETLPKAINGTWLISKKTTLLEQAKHDLLTSSEKDMPFDLFIWLFMSITFFILMLTVYSIYVLIFSFSQIRANELNYRPELYKYIDDYRKNKFDGEGNQKLAPIYHEAHLRINAMQNAIHESGFDPASTILPFLSIAFMIYPTIYGINYLENRFSFFKQTQLKPFNEIKARIEDFDSLIKQINETKLMTLHN